MSGGFDFKWWHIFWLPILILVVKPLYLLSRPWWGKAILVLTLMLAAMVGTVWIVQNVNADVVDCESFQGESYLECEFNTYYVINDETTGHQTYWNKNLVRLVLKGCYEQLKPFKKTWGCMEKEFGMIE